MRSSMLLAIVLFSAIALWGCQTTQDANVTYVNLTDIVGPKAPTENITEIPAEPQAPAQPPAVQEPQTPEEPKAPAEQPKPAETAPTALFTITAVEGDLVSLKPKAYDPDSDSLQYFYSLPVNASGQWQTKVGDAGEYLVTVTVSDGELQSSQGVKLIVKPKNKAPVIQVPDTLTFKELDTVKINPTVTDAEGDKVRVTYSGWMNSDEKATTYTDAGTYDVTITATDGISTVEKKVKVVIEDANRPPSVAWDAPKAVTEGDLVTATATVRDEDGDKATVTYASPLDSSGKWQTAVGDAGTYTLKVTASDGKDTVSKEAILVVEAQNKAPVINVANTITVKEGETVRLDAAISDPDGDQVTTTYSGWMSGPTKATTYGDAGTYTVGIRATDGKLTTSKEVKVVVEKVNRAPVIIGIQ